MASSSVHHPSKFPPPPTAPSKGTLQLMEVFQKLKRENETLKASKSNAPSEGTLQLVEEFEKLKRENEMLKASKSNALSERSIQVRLELEKMKKENEMLKANKSNASSEQTMRNILELEKMKRESSVLKASQADRASKSNAPAADMPDQTRHALEQLERVKRENAALKPSKSDKAGTKDERLAYLERNRAAATKARMDEILKMIISSQETDLVFLVDSTFSMQVKLHHLSMGDAYIDVHAIWFVSSSIFIGYLRRVSCLL